MEIRFRSGTERDGVFPRAAFAACLIAPRLGETRPLLLPVVGRDSRDNGLSRGALHLILKEVFGMAAERLRARGPDWEGQAAVLANASAHWLRHTAGSHMTDPVGRPALCAGQFWPCLHRDHERLPAHSERKRGTRPPRSGTALAGPARHKAASSPRDLACQSRFFLEAQTETAIWPNR